MDKFYCSMNNTNIMTNAIVAMSSNLDKQFQNEKKNVSCDIDGSIRVSFYVGRSPT